MIARFIAGTKLLFRLHHPGRSLTIFPDDVFLVSFPKSGNTWTRFLIANLIHPEKPASFSNIHELIPDPEGTAKRVFDRVPRPRIIKSHTCFNPEYPRVIYVVRDPRDVALSQYHYHRKRRLIEDQYPMETFVARFLAGDTCSYGSWAENVSTWLVTRKNDPRFLLLRYEDLIEDTPRELSKIAAFLGSAGSRERILQAVERSSANNMRKLEKIGSQVSSMTKTSRQDLPFVRAAGSGGWRAELPEPLVARIEAEWAPLMRSLRYELSTRPASESAEFNLVRNEIRAN
jgi:Sulfotransferase domain